MTDLFAQLEERERACLSLAEQPARQRFPGLPRDTSAREVTRETVED